MRRDGVMRTMALLWKKKQPVFTFCDSFSSSSLTVSMCDRDLRHSLLKMSFISGERSDRTFRHSEMRSTSSSVIGFLGREDLPRCSTVAMMSMASATKDWNRQQAWGQRPNHRLMFTRANGCSHFAFSYLERYPCNARPLCWAWWPRTLPRKSLHPSGSL